MCDQPTTQNEVRFWEQVEKGSGQDDCWIWTGARSDRGYGRVYYEGRYRYAHRVAWELEHGELAADLQLMFHCLNHSCVRPDHHIPKRPAEAGRFNAKRGVMARGDRHGFHLHPDRAPGGRRNGRAKLTDEHVGEIRARYAAKEAPITRLAAEYGVGTSQIWRIVTGQTRKV